MFFWMVACGVLVRLAVASVTITPYLHPERVEGVFGIEGAHIAWSVVHGKGFGNPLDIPTGPSAWRPPVFPYLMAGFFGAFGSYSMTAAILMVALNILISAVTCIPIYRLGEISFDARVGRWAGWTWAFFPYALVNSTDKIFDTPASALVVAVLLLETLRMRQATRPRQWAWHGALWGAGALTHASILIALPFYWLWVLRYQAPRAGLRLRLAATGALAFMVCLAPWVWRNYAVFGRFVPIRSNLAMELRVGNAQVETIRDENLHPTVSRKEARRMQQLGELAYMDEKMGQFRQFVRDHPGEFAVRTVRRFFHFWFSVWEYRPARLLASPFETAEIPFASFLTLTALAGLWQLAQRDRWEAFPWALFLALYPLVVYFSHRSYRYRHPVDPVLVVLAVAALAAWWEQRRGRRTASQADR
jgi:4-amino-4-deoxy-L-arabinose transferase-like glycosyltransferase